MFYELDWADTKGSAPWRRDSPPPPSSSFEGTVNALALLTAELERDSKLVGLESPTRIVDGLVDESIAREKANIVSAVMPDGYAIHSNGEQCERSLTRSFFRWLRVFHPQILLHELIASLIVFRMTAKNAIDHGFAAMPEQARIDSCPIHVKPQQPLGIQQPPKPQLPKPQPPKQPPQTHGTTPNHRKSSGRPLGLVRCS